MTRTILVSAAKYGLGLGLLAFVIWRHWAAGPMTRQAWGTSSSGRFMSVRFSLPSPSPWSAFSLPLFAGGCWCGRRICRFTLGNAFRLGLIGLFWNTFLPGSVGGDAVKAFLPGPRTGPPHRRRFHGPARSRHWLVGLVLAGRHPGRSFLAGRRRGPDSKQECNNPKKKSLGFDGRSARDRLGSRSAWSS